MFDNGVLKLDEEGSYVPVTDPAEQQHIRHQVSLSKQRSQQDGGQAPNQNNLLDGDGLE